MDSMKLRALLNRTSAKTSFCRGEVNRLEAEILKMNYLNDLLVDAIHEVEDLYGTFFIIVPQTYMDEIQALTYLEWMTDNLGKWRIYPNASEALCRALSGDVIYTVRPDSIKELKHFVDSSD